MHYSPKSHTIHIYVYMRIYTDESKSIYHGVFYEVINMTRTYPGSLESSVEWSVKCTRYITKKIIVYWGMLKKKY